MMRLNHINNKNVIAVGIICIFSFKAVAQTQSVDRTRLNDSIVSQQFDQTIASLPFSEKSLRSSTSAITVLTGEQLSRFPSSNLVEALNGLIPSLRMYTNNYAPGSVNVNYTIRDLSYSVLVDGIERSMADLNVEEVESVTVIRGLTARAMYGNAITNGAIIVKTKKGIKGEGKFNVGLEHGQKTAMHKPEWINAYEYAKLYNQAAINDGLDPKYSQEDLDGYAAGDNHVKYPDEDLYDELINPNMGYTKAFFNYIGGNEANKYFLHMGYLSEGRNLMKIKPNTYDQFRIRANVDMDINDKIKLYVGAVASLDMLELPPNMSGMWQAISSYPPNAYPVEIKPDTFGTSQSFPVNPVADQLLLGGVQNTYKSGQSNIKLDFDLGDLTKGLAFSTYLTYDIYQFNQLTRKSGLTYTKYIPDYSDLNPDSLILIPVGLDKPSPVSAISGNNYNQQFGSNLNLSYHRKFADHEISSNLVYFIQQRSQKGSGQDYKIQDASFMSSYNYQNKYYFDLVLSYTGNMNLSKDNRYDLFPSFGAAWILSEEDFLKESERVNFLKLRAEYGQMGLFNNNNAFLYRTEWRRGGGVLFGSTIDNKQENISTTYLLQQGNPDLKFGKIYDVSIGIDALLFNSKLGVEINYYNTIMDGLVASSVVPDILGTPTIWSNYNKTRYYGIDGYVKYSDQVGDFSYLMGINFGLNKSERVKINSIKYEEAWLNHEGDPVDAIYGFEALGLFTSETDVNDSPEQFMGSTEEGNIKYNDLNDDQSVNSEFDRKMIGQYNPKYKLGLIINLSYKQFALYAVGTGYFDMDVNLRTNPYFYASGNQKYSSYVRDNAYSNGGSNPILSTGVNTNDNQASSYWLTDGSFFKLKNVELSYTLGSKSGLNLPFEKTKFFARGTNLFVISQIETLDPENLNGGISEFTSMRTLTGGFSIFF